MEKFSSIINIDSHWVSFTLIPSNKNNRAYVIYRDPNGKEMPSKLKNTLLILYPEADIVYSKIKLQKDSHSSGVFAVLACVGDKILDNMTIIGDFHKKDAISRFDIKISQIEKNYNRSNVKESYREYSQRFSI
jgi:hypothetical protein